MKMFSSLLVFIIVNLTTSCYDYSTQPIAPGFDHPVVNDFQIVLEDETKLGNLYSTPIETLEKMNRLLEDAYAFPSIATESLTFLYRIEDDTILSIFIVKANTTMRLGETLYFGSKIGSSTDIFTIYNNKFVSIGTHTFTMDLSDFQEGVYVVYIQNSTDGKILGEAAFFKTNKTNKERIYKQLNIGKYR